MSVKIRILKTKSALQKMVDACIARGVAESIQGKILLAQVDNKDGYAFVKPDQGWPAYFLPRGSFSVFVSRAAALAQAKRISPYKVKRARRAKKI